MQNNYDNSSDENFLFGKSKENPFQLPEGYTDSFAKRLQHKIEMEEELKEFPILSSLRNAQSFSVPENYFELIENKLFEQFELINELSSFSILSSIQKQNSFIVSPDYFENVADKIKESYHESKLVKPTILEHIFNFILKPKVAFAYSIIILIGVGSFFYFNQTQEVLNPGECKTLACLEKAEILKELKMSDLTEENIYELIDEEELNKQLFDEEVDESKLDDSTSEEKINTL